MKCFPNWAILQINGNLENLETLELLELLEN